MGGRKQPDSPWRPFLDRADFVVLDGGLATELERRGADLDDPLWSAKQLLENPNLIRQVHADYLSAGADVVTSASYQASFAGFARLGLHSAEAAELMRRSVRLAQEARDAFWSQPPPGRVRPLIAASIGCFGAVLHDGSEYRGDYPLSLDQLIAWHRPRLEVLAASGADLLAFETLPCLLEARAIARLLHDYSSVPAWVSFSCCDESRVCHGEPLTDCIAEVDRLDNVLAVGVNCTAPELVESLLRSVTTEKPLLAYPNQGESWDAARHCWVPTNGARDWQSLARTWHRAGARLIGGCCRTTPQTIADVARAACTPSSSTPR